MILLKFVRMHVLVEGRVQGVYYRASAEAKARSLGLTGWIRNLPSGKVEAVIEGPEDKVIEMIEWCKVGPIAAHVTDVKSDKRDYTGEYDDFRLLR